MHFDIGVVIDSSDSIGLKNFKVIKKNLKAMVDLIDVSPTETRIGIIEFGRDAKMITTFAHSQSKGMLIWSANDNLCCVQAFIVLKF